MTCPGDLPEEVTSILMTSTYCPEASSDESTDAVMATRSSGPLDTPDIGCCESHSSWFDRLKFMMPCALFQTEKVCGDGLSPPSIATNLSICGETPSSGTFRGPCCTYDDDRIDIIALLSSEGNGSGSSIRERIVQRRLSGILRPRRQAPQPQTRDVIH